MKKGMILGLIAGMALMAAVLAVPVFAHGPDTGTEAAPTTGGEAWQGMWNACVTGDWEAMAEAAEEFHEQGFGYGWCHGSAWNGAPEEDAGTVQDDAGTQTGEQTGQWDQMNDFMNGRRNGGGHVGGGMMGGGMMGGGMMGGW